MSVDTLGHRFDPRCNALNAWRLTLATGVIVCHSFLVTGHHIPSSAAVRQLLAEGWVDGFFAISGFLITASWMHRPHARDYFIARALRILPGLWVCLIITAFVIAPAAVAIQGGPNLLASTAPIEYVLKNSAVLMVQPDIAGTPTGVIFPQMWDGSLWTLFWEMLCYIAVGVLGVTGLLYRRWLIPAWLVAAMVAAALLPPLSVLDTLRPPAPVDTTTGALILAAIAARLALMFAAGALLYQYRNVIPARWSLVAVSAGIVAASSFTSNYRLIGAIPLAYAIIVSGALVRNARLRLRTDLSYGVYIYAFPIQQLLAICGLGALHPLIFAVIATAATLPLAAMSWFLVERRALALKRRWSRSESPPRSKKEPSTQTRSTPSTSASPATTDDLPT
jgi:peptidoglycan/LPS O-acetylase OafA/YrhL